MATTLARLSDPAERLASLQAQLATMFPDIEPAVISSAIQAEWSSYDAARVQTFVPILVERRVRTQVRLGELPRLAEDPRWTERRRALMTPAATPL